MSVSPDGYKIVAGTTSEIKIYNYNKYGEGLQFLRDLSSTG